MRNHQSSKLNQWLQKPLAGIIIIGLAVLAWILVSPGCILREITGLPCPGCGMTRALLLLLHGDLMGAWQMHPLFWVPPLLFSVALVLTIFAPNKLAKWIRPCGFAIVTLFIVVYLVRMFLFFPNQEPLTYLEESIFGRIGWIISLMKRG